MFVVKSLFIFSLVAFLLYAIIYYFPEIVDFVVQHWKRITAVLISTILAAGVIGFITLF